jgi:excisionase family DNA binding protein
MEKITKKSNKFVSQEGRGYDRALFDNQITDDKLLTKVEIADFLNVSRKTIDRKVHMNEIPYYKVGRLVRFSKERVLAWADEVNQKR